MERHARLGHGSLDHLVRFLVEKLKQQIVQHAVLDQQVATAVLPVPTDAGPYIVTLVRGDAEEPWLAERIRPASQ